MRAAPASHSHFFGDVAMLSAKAFRPSLFIIPRFPRTGGEAMSSPPTFPPHPAYTAPMKVTRIIIIALAVIALAIAAMWLWICLNPGVIYCYKGGVYMSMQAKPLPLL